MSTTPEQVTASLEHLDQKVRGGIENGNLEEVMADISPELRAVLELQTTATGRLAEAFSRPLYLFRFVLKWMTNQKDADFLEQQKVSLAKWDKKKGKAPAGMTQRPETQPHGTASETSGMAQMRPIATPSTALFPTTPTTATIRPADAIVMAARQPPARTPVRRPLTHAAGDTRMDHPQQSPVPEVPSAGPSRPQTDLPAGRTFGKIEDSEEHSSPERPPQPIAGPSRRMPVIHVQRPVNPKAMEVDDEESEYAAHQQSRKRRQEGTEMEESEEEMEEMEETMKQLEKVHRPLKSIRQPAQPTGRYLDPPCLNCSRRGSHCEKDALSAACVHCYIGKNQCDYGARRRLQSKSRKAKGTQLAKRALRHEVESEEEMSGNITQAPATRRRMAKRVKTAAYIEDSNDCQPSRFDTAPPPPPSRSPSPAARRSALGRINGPIATAGKNEGPRGRRYSRRQAPTAGNPSALTTVLERIDELERQAARMRHHIDDIQEFLHVEDDAAQPAVFRPVAWQCEADDEMAMALDRIEALEIQFPSIQDSIRSLQEHTGLPEGYYFRLPYRWEGPPPSTCRVSVEPDDSHPIVVTVTGPAGQVASLSDLGAEPASQETPAKEDVNTATATATATANSHMAEPLADILMSQLPASEGEVPAGPSAAVEDFVTASSSGEAMATASSDMAASLSCIMIAAERPEHLPAGSSAAVEDLMATTNSGQVVMRHPPVLVDEEVVPGTLEAATVDGGKASTGAEEPMTIDAEVDEGTDGTAGDPTAASMDIVMHQAPPPSSADQGTVISAIPILSTMDSALVDTAHQLTPAEADLPQITRDSTP
ncbi:hypothetical protein BYT27DRAFT_7218592 [Phlegmacium glaucopus]|nr:hypothetical protein BYT27DRAFT_7218592 [Phlegmacium glaucopus]